LILDSLVISAIIPLYNQARFLRAAVESILEQSWRELELIVVDDGSTDGSLDTLGRLRQRVTVYSQENRGPAAARNLGVRNASGEVIAFLDADDLWPPEKLKHQVPPLLEDPEIDAVLGRIQCFRSGTNQEKKVNLYGKSFYGVQLGSVLFRRVVFDKVGFFDEKLFFSEDHDWFFRAREDNVKIVKVDHRALYYRIHGENMTRREAPNGYGLTRIVKESLDRRRKKSTGVAPALEDFSQFRTWEGP
jgi:glycosyltransferase involved in cell wall biosynthesis